MLGDPNAISTVLSIKGVISTEEKVQIFLASTQSEKITLLITTIKYQMKRSSKAFLSTLQKANLSLPGDVVEFLQSYFESIYLHQHFHLLIPIQLLLCFQLRE